MPAGVWGKHPSRPDFVRWNAGDVSRLGCDRFLEAAFEELVREGRTMANGVWALLYPAGEEAVVGVIGASRDAVGRVFPLLIADTVRVERLPEAFPLFPLACAAFVDGAEALMRQAGGMPLEALTAGVETLPTPAWSGLGRNDFEAYLLGHELNELDEAMGNVADALPYAVATVAGACAEARRAEPAAHALTIDGPAPTHGTAALWLELVRKGLGSTRSVPTCLWLPEAQGRLLATLGPASPYLLAFASNPAHRHASYWPLRTEVAAAREAARKGLTPAQAGLLGRGDATIADVLGAW